MNKKLIIGVATVGLLLGGTTIVGASMNDNEMNNNVKKEDVVKSEAVVEKDGKISVSEAKEIALSEQDGYVESVELEKEHGITYYEVDIENDDADYDIYIDALTGEVLKVEADDEDDRNKGKNNNNYADVMSLEEAKNIAIEEVGGKVIEAELDEDDGRYEYELELRTDRGEADITIDAVTGEVLELEID